MNHFFNMFIISGQIIMLGIVYCRFNISSLIQ